MQLRTNVRLPGRYREDDVPELPPNPAFVVPTIPYNPNLRPAAFPTLLLDQDPPDFHHSTKKETLDSNTGTLSPEEKRRAIVFRDQRLAPKMPEQGSLNVDEDPREYDGCNALDWDNDEDNPRERWHLSAFSEHVYFNNLSKGMQLVIMRELTNEVSFHCAVEFLCLEESEITEFVTLCQAEIIRNESEDTQISRANERQIALLMSSNWTQGHDEWSAIMEEELYSGLDKHAVPATFSITRSDIEMAKKYLLDFRVGEEFPEVNSGPFDSIKNIPTFAVLQTVVRRLNNYDGVDTSWKDLNFGDEFLEYCHPEEELEDEGTNSQIAMEDCDSLGALAVNDFGRVEPTEISITQTPKKRPSGRRLQTNDRVKIARGLMPTPKKGRHHNPRKVVLKAAPSRLREVFTAADLDTTPQSSATSREPSPDTIIAHRRSVVDSTLRTDSGAVAPRQILSLGRNSFPGHFPLNHPSPPSCSSPASHLPQKDDSISSSTSLAYTSPASTSTWGPHVNSKLTIKCATNIKLTIKRDIPLSSPTDQPDDSKGTRSEASRSVATPYNSADIGNFQETSVPTNFISGSIAPCSTSGFGQVFKSNTGSPPANASASNCSATLENSKVGTQVQLTSGTESVFTAYGMAQSQSASTFTNPSLLNPGDALDITVEEFVEDLAETTQSSQNLNHSVVNHPDVDYNPSRGVKKEQMTPTLAMDQTSNGSLVNHWDIADIARREEDETKLAFAAAAGQNEPIACPDRKRGLENNSAETSPTKRLKISEKTYPDSHKFNRKDQLVLEKDTAPGQPWSEHTSNSASQTSNSTPMTTTKDANTTVNSQPKPTKMFVTKEQAARAAGPALLHEVAAMHESKRLKACSETLIEKTRSAAKGLLKTSHQIPAGFECTPITAPTAESIIAGNVTSLQSSRVQVFVPKRTATELPASSSAEGPATKRPKVGEANPLCTAASPLVSATSQLKIQQKKAASQTRVTNAAPATRRAKPD